MPIEILFVRMLYYNTIYIKGDFMKTKYNNLTDITNMIKHVMIDKDLRQKDICNATGLSKQTISNLLNNRKDTMTLDTLKTLCVAVGCDLVIEFVEK